MRPSPLSLAAAAALASPLAAQVRPDAVLLRHPDVSAEQVVFRYDRDLWLVPREGGTARRLTSGEGAETMPRFSPDGGRVAFAASYDGGTDLYVLPVEGGVPTRVTYHPGRETLCDWHPDGEHLLYWSSEESGIRRAPRIMQVHVSGGQPEALPLPYGTFGALDASGRRIVYTPVSREFRTWRRYRGGMAQDLWLFDLDARESKRLTTDPATDAMPMWHGDSIVFLSDRGEEGIANLWRVDPESGAQTRLTDLDASGVRFPSIGPNDVVYEHAGSLFRYELDGGAIREVPVEIPTDRPNLRAQSHDLSDDVRAVALSPSAKRVVLEARGEIFTVPVDEGATRNLTRSSGVAERDPAWSPDGRWVAYWSDRSGEYELTLRRSDGSDFDGADEHGEERLTLTKEGWKDAPVWSPDSTKIAFSNNFGTIWLHDRETGELLRIGESPTPGAVDVQWSHDSGWLTWSHRSTRTRLSAVFLYDVRERELHEVTSGMFDDDSPTFTRDGDLLLWRSSRRFDASYADLDGTWIYANTHVVMAAPLRADVEPPWRAENDEEPIEDDADEDAAGEGAEEEDEDGDEAERLAIELEGLEARAVRLDAEPGRLAGLVGLDGKLLFARLPRTGSDGGRPSLSLYDLSEAEESTVIEGVASYDPTPDGEHLLVRAGGRWGVVEPAPGQEIDDAIDFDDVRGVFEPRAEWTQMIHDVHRLYRDWFYEPGLHQVDWKGLRDRALAALDSATSREDLHFLIGEMISELNVGHAYNSAGPGVLPSTPSGPRAGLLGVDWAATDGGFRVERVLGAAYDDEARGPLHGTGVGPGHVLVEVDGRAVDASRSVHANLLGTAGRATLLSFADAEGERETVLVEPLEDETSLRYRDWVARKRAYTHERSDGRVGYVHVPDTGQSGQRELYRQFLAEQHRDALVVDERWNSGGQLPDRFLELLRREVVHHFASYGEKSMRWPRVVHDGPKVMLINHSAGSGGDAFPWYFRHFGLGKLVGTRTWGGLVGLGGNPSLVDGSSPSVPGFGFYELDGTWGVENYGVAPDVEVHDDPARMLAGEDPQLDEAIRIVLEEAESWDYARTPRPQGPDRSGTAMPESER